MAVTGSARLSSAVKVSRVIFWGWSVSLCIRYPGVGLFSHVLHGSRGGVVCLLLPPISLHPRGGGPDKKEFKRHISEISWETEVWIADEPEHMIHFNGYKF